MHSGIRVCPSCHTAIDLEDVLDDDPYAGILRARLDNEILPSEAEVAHSVQTITSISSDILFIELQMKQLKTRLVELEAAKEAFESSRRLHRATLAPVRRLPVEVLSYIFALTNAACMTGTELRNMPWTLSHVCRGWRNVALSCPDLWKVLYVWSNDPQEYTQTMLDRSHDRLLDIDICDGTSAVQLAFVFESLPRWRTAEITLASGFPIDGFSCFEQVVGSEYPFLPLSVFSLNLTALVDSTSTPLDVSLPFLHHAPLLCEVNVQGLSQSPDLPWDRIAVTSLTNRSEQDLHDFFISSGPCRKLTQATLEFTPQKFFLDPEEHDAFLHTSLQRLSLVGHRLPPWLSRMRLPALENLYVELTCRNENDTVLDGLSIVDTFLRESASPLKVLTIFAYDMVFSHRETLLTILRSCSATLEKLSIHAQAAQLWWVCDVLTLCGREACDVVRGVKEMFLEGWTEGSDLLTQYYTGDMFQPMVESRRPWLRTLVLEAQCGGFVPSVSFMDYLAELIDDGMDVVFTDTTRSFKDDDKRAYSFVCSPKGVWNAFHSVRQAWEWEEDDCTGKIREIYE